MNLVTRENSECLTDCCLQYVIFTLGSRSVRSTIKYATLQPKWDETFVLSIDSLQNMKLIVDVYDHDRFTADDAMGDTVIDLSVS